MTPQPGDRVRILRPDKPAHALGRVIAPQDGALPVWVQHWCDCWDAGTWDLHTRGYDNDEIEVIA